MTEVGLFNLGGRLRRVDVTTTHNRELCLFVLVLHLEVLG